MQPQDTQGNEVIVDKGKGKGPLAPSTDEDSESEKDDGDSEEAESNQEHSSEPPTKAAIGRPRGRPKGATNKANNVFVEIDLSKAHPCRSSRHSNAVAGPSNLGKRKTSEEEDLSSGKSKKKKDNAKSVAGKSVIRRILRDQQAKQGGRI